MQLIEIIGPRSGPFHRNRKDIGADGRGSRRGRLIEGFYPTQVQSQTPSLVLGSFTALPSKPSPSSPTKLPPFLPPLPPSTSKAFSFPQTHPSPILPPSLSSLPFQRMTALESIARRAPTLSGDLPQSPATLLKNMLVGVLLDSILMGVVTVSPRPPLLFSLYVRALFSLRSSSAPTLSRFSAWHTGETSPITRAPSDGPSW